MNQLENIIINKNYGRYAIAMFIFLLIVSGNYLGNLFPCRVQHSFENNIWFKHFLGFFTLLFFVLLTLPNDEGVPPPNVLSLLSSSSLLYIFFIILSNTPSWIWLFVFILSSIIYLLELNKNYLKSLNKDEDDNNRVVQNNNQINTYLYIQTSLTTISILITLLGFIIYLGEKKNEYKKNFSYITFILGAPNCKGITKNKNITTSLKHIFD
tara:strand:+ start:1361 stop:1993 length:633 start_codon:yes stop_codon:yes gene_type:complete